uniref:CCHC-type domain-containing protein n=1 Tax=Davidia involucrata TaxID=16924 RepID=A0A5B6ZCT4_DAVIN
MAAKRESELQKTVILLDDSDDEGQKNDRTEKMAQQTVIVLDDSDDEGEKHDRGYEIDGTVNRKRKRKEEIACQKETYVYRSRAEENKILADLTGYPQVAALLALEAKIKENRMKKSKKRKKKKPKIEPDAQIETAAAAEEENKANTSKAVETIIAFRAGDDVRSAMVTNLCSLSSERKEAIADLGSSKCPGEMVLTEAIVRKEGNGIVAEEDNVYAVKEGEQADTAETLETIEALETESVPKIELIMPKKPSVYAPKEGKRPETVEAVETTKELETESVLETESILPEKLFVKVAEEKKQADSSKNAETRISLETESVAGNIVLQKLLRGPRYFDLPKSGWGMCFNCGEDDHTAANCIAKKRKKPCFVCGSLEHNAKHCKQRNDCFICSGRGHLAKDCTEKHPTNNKSSNICLRCGDSGHNMFSCINDYSPDDLKEIQCYVCKAFGHLCCADFVDEGPRQVSCYNCGQSGHLGSGCTKLRGVASGSRSTFLCYKCGEEGHFARECINHSKVGRGTGDFATPERFPDKKKDILGFKSAPHEIYNARKKERRCTETVNMTEGQSRWKERRDTVQPQNLFSQNSHEISAFSSYGQSMSHQHPRGIFNTEPQSSEVYNSNIHQFMSPQYPRGIFNHYTEPQSSEAYKSNVHQYMSPQYPQGIFDHYTVPQSSQAYNSNVQHQGFGGY